MLEIVILAAGQGMRMHSLRPKVLHPVGGKSMLLHVLKTAANLSADRVHVVYGQGGDMVKAAVEDDSIHWCHQSERLGTGHAVLQAMPAIDIESTVLVLYADVPLIRMETLQNLILELGQSTLSLLSVKLENPSGYGRIVRDVHGLVQCIKEENDADVETRKINEVNTGILAARAKDLNRWLENLDNNNTQGEYYLTDCIARCAREGGRIHVAVSANPAEVMGVNDKLQLAKVERTYQLGRANAMMRQGVTLADPSRVDIRGDISVGQDVSLDINVILEGQVRLADNVTVGAHCILKNVDIGKDTEVRPFSAIENAVIGERCIIGPYARIRPETHLGNDVHIGNFVEVKKSTIDDNSKINHLSYIGDTQIGKRVNVGAGTITCNYDGASKHSTQIGDDVFIGSDTQLIAPIHIQEGSTLGAGSTITRDTPAHELTLSRSKQVTVPGWQRPGKKLKK